LTFIPDGQWLASASFDKPVIVWSALLRDAKTQTVNDTQAAAAATIKKFVGKVTFD
jgi:hypothetical protein